jgi:predicted dehydrogenase
MKEIRCGIVGCGTILPWHANPLERIEGAQLVAVADAAKERAQEAAKIYGVDAYEDYHQMLKRDDLDLVHICTISGTHGTIGLDAISAGKHVLIEKPIEIQLDRIDALIDAAREKGVKLGGVFQMRFYPSTIKLVDAVKSGRFGKIVLAEYENKSMRTIEYYNKDAWRGTWQFDGGGALMNQGVHGVDIIQYVAGPVTRVCALTKTLTRPIEVEDTAAAVMEFQSGAIGILKGTTSLYPGFPSTFFIHGERGSVAVQGENIITWQFDETLPGDDEVMKANVDMNLSTGSDPKAHTDTAHESCIRSFLEAVREDKTPSVSGEEARKSVELILAIYHSSKTGKWVELPFTA